MKDDNYDPWEEEYTYDPWEEEYTYDPWEEEYTNGDEPIGSCDECDGDLFVGDGSLCDQCAWLVYEANR